MRRALIEFGQRARRAEIAVVFFAGHGMEVGGENWLIPTDAELKTDLNAEHEAIALRSILPMVSAASKLGLVMLDACRNNPFAAKMQRTVRTRAVSRGLTYVEPSGSVLVAYAARDGTTAADGQGRNSPFTARCSRIWRRPGWRSISCSATSATTCCRRPNASRSRSSTARCRRTRSTSSRRRRAPPRPRRPRPTK